MRARALPIACLAVALLGLAAGLYKLHAPPGPLGDEATHVLIAQSLWHDHDLAFDHRDLQRAYRLWDCGPAGLTLFTTDGGKSMHFGAPFVYALAALPFYVALGAQGLLVFNMLLFLFMAWGGWVMVRGEGERSGSPGLLVAGFFFASAAFGWVFRMEPEVFTMACVFFPLLAWLRLRSGWTGDGGEPMLSGDRASGWLAAGGALLAAGAVERPQVALFALPILFDLAASGRRPASARRAAVAFVAGGLLCYALVAVAQRHLTGVRDPARAPQVRTFTDQFPVESAADLWGPPVARPSWREAVKEGMRLLPRNLYYLFLGRHAGLLPYFPFALLALGLGLAGWREPSRLLLLAAAAGYCLLVLVAHPHDWHGGPDALGSASFAAIYPALLFAGSGGARPGRVRAPWLLLAFAAAGLWTLPALAFPVEGRAPEPTTAEAARMPAFAALPLELTLVNHLPGYAFHAWNDAVWMVPRWNFSTEENHPAGVWVRGASRSEVFVLSARPIASLHFQVWSLSDQGEVTLASGAETVRVRFDTEGKRQGTPIDLAVAPKAHDLGFLPNRRGELYYRLVVTVSDGLVPARRMAGSRDDRYLGVFLDFTGAGP